MSTREPAGSARRRIGRDRWIALDFPAQQTKGVYVSFDTSTSGSVSRMGLPGLKARETDFNGDWMVEVILED